MPSYVSVPDAELVAGDGRPATEEWMIVESEWFGRSGQEELRPRADLVIGGRDMPRVVFERQRVTRDWRTPDR